MHSWSLARRILVTQWLVLLVLTLLFALAAYLRGREVVFERTMTATTQVATLAADDPRVSAAFSSSNPTQVLQPLADRIMRDTGMDFSTFISRDGVRLSYHRPGYVGTEYTGTLDPVWEGTVVKETSSTATAGESVRSVVPIYSTTLPDGGGAPSAATPRTIVGALTVGKQVRALDVVAASGLSTLVAISAGFALVLGAGAWFASRYLRKVTAGLGPEALARHFAVADVALLSLDEGIVMLNERREVVFRNRAANALLGLEAATPHSPVALASLSLPSGLGELLASGEAVEDVPYRVGHRMVIVSQRPVMRRGLGHAGERGPVPTGSSQSPAGGSTVLTVHDHSAVQSLAGELASIRSLTDALRSQNHDHSNRLHTLLSLLEVGKVKEAKGLLLESLGKDRAAHLNAHQADTVLMALAHGKIAEAAERGVELTVDVRLATSTRLPAIDLLGIFGNLLDNAIDAAEAADAQGERWVRFEAALEDSSDPKGPGSPRDAWLAASVANGGASPTPEQQSRMFESGYSTKAQRALGRGQGLAIVASSVKRLGGSVEVATDSGTVFTVWLPLETRSES